MNGKPVSKIIVHSARVDSKYLNESDVKDIPLSANSKMYHDQISRFVVTSLQWIGADVLVFSMNE